MGAPAVSILVAVYNTQEFLPLCLDSIRSQSFQDFQVICIDDGSNDNSLSILQAYAKSDSRFVVYSQSNHGLGYTKERALSLAEGKYVLFLDSDDFIEPDTLQVMLFRAEQTKAQIVGFPYDIFYNHQRGFVPVPQAIDRRFLPQTDVFCATAIPATIFQVFTPEVSNKLWLREFFSENNIHFGNYLYAEDYCVTYCSLAVAERVTTVHDKAYYHYRKGRPDALTAADSNPLSFMGSYIGLKNRLSEIGFYELLQQSYANRTLSGVVYEYNRHSQESTRRQVLECLITEGFQLLDLADYGPSYFYDRKEYRLFQDFLNPPGVLRQRLRRLVSMTKSAALFLFNVCQYIRLHGWAAALQRAGERLRRR